MLTDMIQWQQEQEQPATAAQAIDEALATSFSELLRLLKKAPLTLGTSTVRQDSMWDPKQYLVGITNIDGQHFNMARQLLCFVKAVDNRQGKDKLIQLLAKLKIYTEDHFSCEETLMAQLGNPDTCKLNREAHEKFTQTLDSVIELVKLQGPTEELSSHFKEVVVQWFLNHTCCVDKAGFTR